jgi:DNA topoisomerase-2
MLQDVSAMVKGIGSGSNDGPTRLFHPASASRPTSSHGLKQKSSRRDLGGDSISEDETDWAGLAQNSPHKATNRTVLSDNEDTMDIDVPKPVSKPAAKPAPKAKAIPKAKETLKPKKVPAASLAAPEPKPLSPAAKAYAAKKAMAGGVQAKAGASKSKKKLPESDDDEDVDQLANDILSDDDDEDSPVKPIARPARRAAAAPKSKYVVDDDDDDDEDEEESEDFDDDDESD